MKVNEQSEDMKMKYTRSARILKSMVHGVSLIMIASFFVNGASATSQFSDESEAVIEAGQSIEMDRKITLENIRSVKDLEIFGSEMMTKSELAKFRNDLKQIKTQEQLERYLADHRERMSARATKRGVELDSKKM